MSTDFGKPMGMATQDELAIELTSRAPFPALVIFQEDETEEGKLAYLCRQSFNDRANIASLLRSLAAHFESEDFHPAREI